MHIIINHSILEIVEGDITRQDTEAIVNAANEQLRVGGGVDGAINRAGGPRIQEEARRIGYCPTGQAVITTGGDLKASFVIHTVGPIYKDGRQGEPELLASCYRESLALARARGIRSIAFPSISTGVYGYPVADAARIALGKVKAYLQQYPDIRLVRFVLFGQEAFEAYAAALGELAQE
ncbi:MAG: O-acetyl-ADP-ribose deacetylase [Deltaproteobacteria bacterium]|nr:O-acetyl-ADP-ribose deacetylase [Deltaproteobacteria bacterium]